MLSKFYDFIPFEMVCLIPCKVQIILFYGQTSRDYHEGASKFFHFFLDRQVSNSKKTFQYLVFRPLKLRNFNSVIGTIAVQPKQSLHTML